MKTKLLLFLALATAAHATNSIGDRLVAPPFESVNVENFVGNITLARPGVYSAAGWNIVGQLRFGQPGEYTLLATAGGINLTGQFISPGGPATLHVQYAGGFNLIVGPVGSNVTVVDDTSANPVLPGWTRCFTVSLGDYFVYSPAIGSPGFCQWRRNGVVVPGATQPTLTLPRVRATDAGIYSVEITDAGGTRTIVAAVVGIRSTARVTGDAVAVGTGILHANGNRYDQFLMTGPAATVTAERGKVARVSYVDLTDDIVQVEFSGAGSLTVLLANPSGPELPANYHQAVRYMKGHATLLVADADATTNVSVFSVGRANAADPTLCKDGVVYDGIADLAALGISSATGWIGGLRLGNAHLFAANGLTGVFAPGVASRGPVRFGNVSAFDQATPTFLFGGVDEVEIAGGDLKQDNGRPIEVRGIGGVRFVAGGKSDGVTLPAQANEAQFISNGVDVTSRMVRP